MGGQSIADPGDDIRAVCVHMLLEHTHDAPVIGREILEAVDVATELAAVIGVLGAVIFDEHLVSTIDKVASPDKTATLAEHVHVKLGFRQATTH
nr:hypothetical protein [Agreia bicolorata]